MSTDPRQALDTLIGAFEYHLEVARRTDVDESVLEEAERRLRDAFFTYDDELFTQFEVELPFDMYVDDDEDVDEEEYDDDDLDVVVIDTD